MRMYMLRCPVVGTSVLTTYVDLYRTEPVNIVTSEHGYINYCMTGHIGSIASKGRKLS